MTEDARNILLHMLGLQPGEEGGINRNLYVCGRPAPAGMAELVRARLVRRGRRPGFLSADARVWLATDAGRAAALAEHRRTLPKLTRGQRRYREWLRLDGLTGETFGQFLKRGERDWRVDFLAKYVRPEKVDGRYLPEISGQPVVINTWGDR